MKDFVAISFSEYFKPTNEKLYSKLNKKENLRNFAKLIYVSQKAPDEVEIYVQLNSSDNCMHLYNAEVLILFDPKKQIQNLKLKTN